MNFDCHRWPRVQTEIILCLMYKKTINACTNKQPEKVISLRLIYSTDSRDNQYCIWYSSGFIQTFKASLDGHPILLFNLYQTAYYPPPN